MTYCKKCEKVSKTKIYRVCSRKKWYEYERCVSCQNKQVVAGVKKWREKHKDRVNAHRRIYVAIRNGSLVKESCPCGSSKNVEAHHSDYSKPLEVTWLCRSCHIEEDKLRRRNETLSTSPSFTHMLEYIQK